MPDKKPNIYPPSIIDPLLPGGIPKQPDPEGAAKADYLGKLARENLTDTPCASCGNYLVKIGDICPGCGAAR